MWRAWPDLAYSRHRVAWYTVEAIVLPLSPDFPHSQPTPNCYGSVRELACYRHQIREAAQPPSLAVAGEMGDCVIGGPDSGPCLVSDQFGVFLFLFF